MPLQDETRENETDLVGDDEAGVLDVLPGEGPQKEFKLSITRYDSAGNPVTTVEDASSVPADGAKGKTGTGDAPSPEEAAEWRRLAYENGRKAEQWRRQAELYARLRQNPNDVQAIEALTQGKHVDGMPGVSQNDEEDELASLIDGDDAEASQGSGSRGGGKRNPEPVGREPENEGLTEDEINQAQQRVDQVVDYISGQGYGETATYEFLGWLDGSQRPALEDLWYAFLAQRRRIGQPLQKTRKSAADEFGSPASFASGESGRPTVVEPQRRPNYGANVKDPNNLF